MSNEFDFDTKNGWKHYADAVSQEQMDVLATRYMDFLSHAKTERETVAYVCERLKAQGYAPQRLCERDDALKRVVDQLRTGFSDGVSYDDLAQRLLQRDEYMLLQDFASYCAAEQRMAKTYADRAAWDRMSLLNIARSGIFAADRAVAQYADNIWHVPHK